MNVRPKRKTLHAGFHSVGLGVARYLNPPKSRLESHNKVFKESTRKDVCSNSNFLPMSARHSSPKAEKDNSNLQLIINDSVASAVHPVNAGSKHLHCRTLSLDRIPSSSQISTEHMESVKYFKKSDNKSSDIQDAESIAWILVEYYLSNLISTQTDIDLEQIRSIVNRIKLTRREIIRLQTAKQNWEKWFTSVVNLHTEHEILSELVEFLGLNDDKPFGQANSLSENVSWPLGENPLDCISKLSSNHIVPTLNRLPVQNITTGPSLTSDLQQVAEVTQLFSQLCEDELTSLGILANEINQIANQLEYSLVPKTQSRIQTILNCLNYFIQQTSIKFEKTQQFWLDQLSKDL